MNTPQKYRFEYYSVQIGVPGRPIRRSRTVDGLNRLDANAVLRRTLYREGCRIHSIVGVTCLGRPEPAPDHSSQFQSLMDKAHEAQQLLQRLEARLA